MTSKSSEIIDTWIPLGTPKQRSSPRLGYQCKLVCPGLVYMLIMSTVSSVSTMLSWLLLLLLVATSGVHSKRCVGRVRVGRGVQAVCNYRTGQWVEESYVRAAGGGPRFGGLETSILTRLILFLVCCKVFVCQNFSLSELSLFICLSSWPVSQYLFL